MAGRQAAPGPARTSRRRDTSPEQAAVGRSRRVPCGDAMQVMSMGAGVAGLSEASEPLTY